eukprot:1160376-Pelagomonas_calceolata.AAC.7
MGFSKREFKQKVGSSRRWGYSCVQHKTSYNRRWDQAEGGPWAKQKEKMWVRDASLQIEQSTVGYATEQ